jgi:CRISPR-associated protein (TIGR03986 family)
MPVPVAHAPFNFVPASHPISWTVVEDAKEPTYSGTIGVQLTALEPLLVSGKQDDGAVRRFFRANGSLCIPGSSIKGVVRGMLEALSISALSPITPRSVFFRDLNNSDYLTRFVDSESVPGVSIYRSRAGYLRKRDGRWEILPCEWAKVIYRDLDRAGVRYQNGRGSPSERVRGLLDDPKARQGIGGAMPAAADHHHPKPWNANLTLRYRRLNVLTIGGDGRLVTAGHMQTRHFESVFYPPSGNAQPICVQHLWDDFEEWLEQHKPRQDLLKALQSKDAKAYYKHGVPVFWLEAKGSSAAAPMVRAFGFCQLFCVPYRQSLEQLVGGRDPEEPVSLAERIFGFTDVRINDRPLSQKGRVTFGAARCTKETRELEPRTVVPGNPSPTCLGIYLEQNAPNTINRTATNHGLNTYDSGNAAPRGRKFYWHRPRAWEAAPAANAQNDRVQASYAPIDRGAQFESVVHFERLTEVELGALLAAIQLPDGHAHKLGLGKPFGLGSVRLVIVKLSLERDRERYRSLKSRAMTAAPTADRIGELIRIFESRVVEICEAESFETIDEIRCLRALTNYASPPPVSATAYMPLQRPNRDDRVSSVYANKPVLPSASSIARRPRHP